MSRSYYNEIDPYCVEWLKNLISAGHIPAGDVDNRSIEDVRPSDLSGYTQCHFFAGIGGWAYSARLAGIPDDEPIWTGSCPCQPFSQAGKGAGFADERHLWPTWFHLISQCRPARIFGEQVASPDGLAWFDLVQADLEGAGYAVGAADLCAAGVGAPHIRQRLWFVADSDQQQWDRRGSIGAGRRVELANISPAGGLVNPGSEGLAQRKRIGGVSVGSLGADQGQTAIGASVCAGGLADNLMQQRPHGQPGISNVDDASGRVESTTATAGLCGDMQPGPVNGFWRDADWLLCRDGKWRPVEPGTFPLAHGVPARVGKLRAYGNAIVSQEAAEFIKAVRSES